MCKGVKEMEREKIIKIDKISGASIGSISALLYHINALDIINIIYYYGIQHLKTNSNLDIFNKIFEVLLPLLPSDICETMTNRIYISYYNVKKCKKVIKYKYKSVFEIFETIKRSCFVPKLINGNITWREKYIDGLNPYVFIRSSNKKILHLDLFGYDKIFYIFSVKNEKTNIHRILTGMLDTHLFFIKKRSTQMCSYIGERSILYRLHNYIKYIAECCIVYIVSFYVFIKNIIDRYLMNKKDKRRLVKISFIKNIISMYLAINAHIINYFCFIF